MSSPEEIANAREAAQSSARDAQRAVAAREYRAKIEKFIPEVLQRLEAREWPLDTHTFSHKRIIWNGQEKLCWLLRDGRGDGDYHQVYLLSTGELVETDYNSNKGYRADYKAYEGSYMQEVVDALRDYGKTPEERAAALKQTVTLVYPPGGSQSSPAERARVNDKRLKLVPVIKQLAIKAATHQLSLGLPGFDKQGIIERLSLGCDQDRGVGEVFLNANGNVMRVREIVFGVNGWADVDIRPFDETFPVPGYLEAIQEHIRVQEHVIAELTKLLPPKNFLQKLFS